MKPVHPLGQFLRRAFAPDASDLWNRLALLILLVLVATGPLLERVAPAIKLLAFLGLACAFLSASRTRPLPPPRGAAWAAAAGTLLALFQLLPLPDGVLREIAPANIKIYHETAQILGIFGRKAPPARVSIAPLSTSGALLDCLAFLALFAAAARCLRSRPRRRLLAWAVIFGGILQAALLAFEASGLPAPGETTGLLAASGVLPASLGVALALALGLYWSEILTGGDRRGETTAPEDRLGLRLARISQTLLPAGLIAGGLALSRSGAGMIAAAIAVLVQAAVTHAQSRRGAAGGRRVEIHPAALVFPLAIAVFLGVMAVRRADPRGNTGAVRETAIAAWKQSPVAGFGLGSFRDAFRRAQPRTLTGLVDEAPSDLYQLLVTGGAAGVLIAASGAASLALALAAARQKQRHREESVFALAGLCALLFFCLQGTVSFNLAPSAGPAILATVLGGAWAAANAHGAEAS